MSSVTNEGINFKPYVIYVKDKQNPLQRLIFFLGWVSFIGLILNILLTYLMGPSSDISVRGITWGCPIKMAVVRKSINKILNKLSLDTNIPKSTTE